MAAKAQATRRRRMEPDARRAEILAVARRRFGSTGYASVSISDIASEAGVARALVRYRSSRSGDKAVRARLRKLAALRRRLG